MKDVGRILMIMGLVIAVMGFLFWTGVGKGWIGKLPGDISIQRDNFRFYFPLATCILISIVLSLLMWIFRR